MKNRISTNLAISDFATCDKEPIHIPGSIQPHGIMLTLREPGCTILQASVNAAEWFGIPAEALLGKTLDACFGAQGKDICAALNHAIIQTTPFYLRTITLEREGKASNFHLLAHRHDRVLILELEEAQDTADVSFHNLYPLIHSFIARLPAAGSIEELGEIAAHEVQTVTGFGRVLIYKFDTDWNGEVIAERRVDEYFPSLMGHHFPASDIPRQARELYRLNRLRLIPNAYYTPVALHPPINPVTQQTLDLSYAALRSVSPVHVEYMRNMETISSMSISILVDGKLWGLISCHHRTAFAVPFDIRTACDFIGQFLSLHISAKENSYDFTRRIELKAINSRLLAYMAAEASYSKALLRYPADLLALTGAKGAAILLDEHCELIGETPNEEQVRRLADWLNADSEQEIYYTLELSERYPDAKMFKNVASGLLAISISKLHQGYVMWFKPEVLQTIKWGGDPRKDSGEDTVNINPRKSFETWKETVHLKATPWLQSEIDAAAELRNAIVGIVLKRAEELADLNQELERSNKELEAFSHTVSHDLRAPFRHIVGYSELIKEMEGNKLSERGQAFLDKVIDSGRFAGQLVDNLLHFSQVGRLPLEPVLIDLNLLVEEVKNDVLTDAQGRRVTWKITPLPKVKGDLLLMRLVLSNLMSNALKYSRKRDETFIEIGYEEKNDEYIFYVKDNGIGFEMEYIDKLFGVFQRLHKMEDFEGTGIGLANVKRIITRQGGRVWAEGKPDHGAVFYFTMPK